MMQVKQLPDELDEIIFSDKYNPNVIINYKYLSLSQFNPDLLLTSKVEAKKIIKKLKTLKEGIGSRKLLKLLIPLKNTISHEPLKFWTNNDTFFLYSPNSKYYFEIQSFELKIKECKEHDMCDYKTYNSNICLAPLSKKQFNILFECYS